MEGPASVVAIVPRCYCSIATLLASFLGVSCRGHFLLLIPRLSSCPFFGLHASASALPGKTAVPLASPSNSARRILDQVPWLPWCLGVVMCGEGGTG